MELFVSSRKTGAQEVDFMIESALDGKTAPLEAALGEFFTDYRVGIYGRNHIKDCILEETDGRVDIANPGIFIELKGFFKIRLGSSLFSSSCSSLRSSTSLSFSSS